jgi:site-specific DNA-methyltransferase (adenine-specific)
MIVEQMLKNAQTPLLHIADVSGSALFQGDCLNIMPLIPDKSVQLILADLPYGYLNRSNVIDWDNEIDLNKLWFEYERIIKLNGIIILTASQPFTSKLILSNEKMFKQEIIWCKKDSADFVNAKNRHLKAHENIIIFSKGNIANGCKNKIVYNPQGLLPKNKVRNVCKKNDTFMGKREQQDGKEYVQEFTNYPLSYIFYNRNDNGKKNEHPTQKPLALMKYLISTYSNENDMVLDNTMGSGTTCLAAKELNRKFIGIEKEANYYEIACRRCGF